MIECLYECDDCGYSYSSVEDELVPRRCPKCGAKNDPYDYVGKLEPDFDPHERYEFVR